MKGAYSSWNMSDYPVIAELRKAFTIKIRNTERKRSTKIWETLEETGLLTGILLLKAQTSEHCLEACQNPMPHPRDMESEPQFSQDPSAHQNLYAHQSLRYTYLHNSCRLLALVCLHRSHLLFVALRAKSCEIEICAKKTWSCISWYRQSVSHPRNQEYALKAISHWNINFFSYLQG